MNLRDYLVEKDGRATREGAECARVAAEAGVTPYYLYMIALGHKRASTEVAKAIETATDNTVARHELRPDIWDPPGAKAAA